MAMTAVHLWLSLEQIGPIMRSGLPHSVKEHVDEKDCRAYTQASALTSTGF